MESLLFKNSVSITDDISIYIPSVKEVLDNELDYFGLVTTLTAMPIDLMVQLDDIGIDFEQIDEYQLFLIMFGAIKNTDTSLVFGDLDLSLFEHGYNEDINEDVLIDTTNDIVIDRVVHNQIANTLRQIHNLEKNIKKPGNAEAKAYMLERARKKQKRNARKNKHSFLEAKIISLVNTEQFKYNYQEVKDITIYQFNQSVKQITNKINYDNRMFGIYTGNIDTKKLSQKELTWMHDE